MSELHPSPAPDAPASDPAPEPQIDRTISPIAGRLAPRRAGQALVLAGLVAGCGVFLVATWKDGHAKQSDRPLSAARQVVAFEPAAAAAGPTLAAPGPDAPRLQAIDPAATTPPTDRTASVPDRAHQARQAADAIRGAPMIAFTRGDSAVGRADEMAELRTPVASSPAAAGELDQLDQLRQGSSLGRARASRLPDRNFLIVAGAAIPCLLQTAMDTATPGYVSCLIPRDVLSDNGAVVLLEKGTRVLGEYRSSLRQGQRRLFVLWTRAVTPAGVAISLASPAADPLGRAGFDGELDTHFWDRFGGALLLSIVDDGAYAVAGRDTGSQTARLPSEAAGIALQNSVNIPPSLRKAQGAEVSIFVAQDLDFATVYGLSAP